MSKSRESRRRKEQEWGEQKKEGAGVGRAAEGRSRSGVSRRMKEKEWGEQRKEGVGVGRIAYSIARGMVPPSTNNHCNYQWYSLPLTG